VQEVYVKKHGSCLGNAPAPDWVLDLMQVHRIVPTQVREMRVGVRASTLAMAGEPREIRVRP
jgi:hypothetical protein